MTKQRSYNEQLKIAEEVSMAYNSTNDFNVFKVKLDLLGIKMEDAQECWTNCNKTLVNEFYQHKNDDIIDFEEFFNKASSKCIKHMVIPYETKLSKIKNYGIGMVLSMKMLSKTGKMITNDEPTTPYSNAILNSLLICLAKCSYEWENRED